MGFAASTIHLHPGWQVRILLVSAESRWSRLGSMANHHYTKTGSIAGQVRTWTRRLVWQATEPGFPPHAGVFYRPRLMCLVVRLLVQLLLVKGKCRIKKKTIVFLTAPLPSKATFNDKKTPDPVPLNKPVLAGHNNLQMYFFETKDICKKYNKRAPFPLVFWLVCYSSCTRLPVVDTPTPVDFHRGLTL